MSIAWLPLGGSVGLSSLRPSSNLWSGKSYAPQAQELRLDMFEAEFTHAGDSCSFEVLLARVACTAIFRAGANRLVPYARTKPLLLPAGPMKAFAVELKVNSARVRSRSCPL
jgi:hypothetical protein